MKTVQVTLTRTYYKEVTINVQVEESLKEEELITFLSTDGNIDDRLEEALSGGEDEYTFYDEKDNFGGHL